MRVPRPHLRLLAAGTALLIAGGFVSAINAPSAAAATTTAHQGATGKTPTPKVIAHSVPHPDGPSDLNEYLPGTVGPGHGAQVRPLTTTVTVSGVAVHGTYSLTPSIYATVTSTAGGTVQSFYYVRTHGTTTWNIANGTEVDGASGTELSYQLSDQMTTAGGNYDYQVQGCQAGSCSALTTITNFVIDPMINSGNRGFFGYYDQRLSAAGSAHVNYATGNLVVDWNDLSVAGINGLGLDFGRAYNSITDPVGLARTDLGNGWTNALTDIQFGAGGAGNVYFIGPSGYLASFLKKGSTYQPVSGLDADLSVATGPVYTITFHHAADGFRAGDVITSDSSNRIASIKDKHGNAITFSYDPYNAANVSTITDTQGRTLSLSNYNAAGQVQTVTDNAGGRTLKYTYDSSGNLATFADAGTGTLTGDAATSYGYDTSGNLTKITDPAGRVTAISYGSGHKVASITAASGTAQAATTVFTYYPVGDSHCTTQAKYACTTVEQDRDATTPNSADAGYEKSTYYVDNSGRVVYVYDAANNKQATSWDVNSNVLTISDKQTTPNTTTATYAGSGNNNPLTLKDPTGMTDTLAYTGTGHPYQPDTQTLPNSASGSPSTTVSYSYTSAAGSATYGDVTKVTQGGVSLQSAYQGDGTTSCSAKPGQLCTTTNGKSGVTSFAYDTKGNLTTVTPPAPLGAVSYTVDALGRFVTVKDGKAQTTTTHYDVLDRVTEVDYPASAKTMKYGYDSDGNVTSEQVTTSSGTVNYSFSYDARNRMTHKSQPANGTAVTAVDYGYDSLGNLTQLQETGGSYPNTVSLTENYTYDDLNLATKVTASASDPAGNSGSTAAMTLGHDANGKRTSIGIGSTETRTLTYDNAGREVQSVATKVSGSVVLASRTYCYVNPVADCPSTPAGAPLTGGIETSLKQRVTDSVAGTTVGYTYDGLSRLTDANTTAGGTDHRVYGYDSDGNRTSQTINGTASSYTYNSADLATSTGYSYDADGNATAVPGLSTLAYNPLNQTTSITKSGTSTAFSYSSGTQDLRTSANGVDASLSGLGTDIEAGGGTYHFYVRDNGGNLLAIIQPDAGGYEHSYYPVTDGQGSVVALTNGSGTVSDTWHYDPYGQVLSHTGSDYNPWQYGGGYTDASTGLIHLGARYYNPADGRFTQQDPAGKGNNLNLYAGDSPVNYSDPSGLNLFDDITGGISTVAGVVATAADVVGLEPVGIAAGVVAGAAATTKAVGDCAGAGTDSCGASVGAAAITDLTAGTSIAASSAGVDSVSIGEDLLGNANDALDQSGAYE